MMNGKIMSFRELKRRARNLTFSSGLDEDILLLSPYFRTENVVITDSVSNVMDG